MKWLTSQDIIRMGCGAGGALWAWIEPTVNFALLCIFAVLIDCISAWRLNRRVRRKYGEHAADGKLKSVHMTKMVSDIMMLFSVMLIAQGIDTYVITSIDIPLANAIAAIFLLKTIVSVCENESSCSDKTWAKIVQRYVVDKTMRHLEIDLSELDTKEDNNEEKPIGPQDDALASDPSALSSHL